MRGHLYSRGVRQHRVLREITGEPDIQSRGACFSEASDITDSGDLFSSEDLASEL